MEVLQNLFLQHLLLVFDKEIKCKGIEIGIEGNVLKYVTREYRKLLLSGKLQNRKKFPPEAL